MNETQNQFALASSGSRIIAALIDYLIYGFTIGILLVITWPFLGYDNLYQSLIDYTMDGTVSETYIAYSLATIILSLAIGIVYYGLVPTKTKGQTLGKKMIHIKAIKSDGTPPSFFTHLARAIIIYGAYVSALLSLALLIDDYSLYQTLNTPFSYITSFVIIISLVMILSRNDKRGLHDLIAKTYVINETSNLPSDSQPTPSKKEDPFEFDYDSLDDA